MNRPVTIVSFVTLSRLLEKSNHSFLYNLFFSLIELLGLIRYFIIIIIFQGQISTRCSIIISKGKVNHSNKEKVVIKRGGGGGGGDKKKTNKDLSFSLRLVLFVCLMFQRNAKGLTQAFIKSRNFRVK